MSSRIMTDVLIVGSAVTATAFFAQAIADPHALTAVMGVINLGTAAFLLAAVRPILAGRPIAKKALAHGALLVLIAGWAAAFWVEYATIVARPSAMLGGLTWSLAGVVYLVGLLLPEGESAEAAPAERPRRASERAPAVAGAR